MRNVNLRRFAYTPMGTFGYVTVGNEFSCYSVERPWLNNKRNLSCIPTGTYDLKACLFRGSKLSYEVVSVPSRYQIKIHVANTMDDLQGCIGLGYGLGFIKEMWAVTKSADAISDFMRHAMMEDSEPGYVPERIEGQIIISEDLK